jgi:hypothetical protein
MAARDDGTDQSGGLPTTEQRVRALEETVRMQRAEIAALERSLFKLAERVLGDTQELRQFLQDHRAAVIEEY